nr:uncharacterized protein CI109_005163 [Kwoniella shandongensis]KAA5526394.1 hypothetical protein CI109_005163 [Kwoniella shandongensis]
MCSDSSTPNKAPILTTLHYLLSRTSPNSTICPSQIPRSLHDTSPSSYPDWRSMMDEVREVVWEEVKAGRAVVTQRGETRDWEGRGEIKGPIRVKKGDKWDESLRWSSVNINRGPASPPLATEVEIDRHRDADIRQRHSLVGLSTPRLQEV